MKTVLAAFLILFVTTIVAVGLPVAAQDSSSITDEHVAQIKNGCPTAIATLSQLHANDGPVFVNRNQAYFSISDKLIARLNSRLALNRFDTTPLVKIASEYSTALTEFRTAFKRYDDAMKSITKMNCVKQPNEFYDEITEARELRGKVNQAVRKLHDKINDYRDAVNVFEEKYQERLKGNSNA